MARVSKALMSSTPDGQENAEPKDAGIDRPAKEEAAAATAPAGPKAKPRLPALAKPAWKRFMLVFYAPEAAVQACKAAVFKAGAGRHPWNRVKYTECCWSTPGRAEFRPAENADPGMGEVGVLREVSEVRVETMCPDGETMRSAVKALLEAHPYKDPMYYVIKTRMSVPLVIEDEKGVENEEDTGDEGDKKKVEKKTKKRKNKEKTGDREKVGNEEKKADEVH